MCLPLIRPNPATARPVLGPTSAETDREALVALYNATDGENWRDSANWLSDAPIGEWWGVFTNDEGRVTGLSLRDSGLRGEIPAELGSLSNLEGLLLGGNDLSGEIPTWLGSLPNLEMLGLSSNDLSGEIPAELGSLSNLEGLSLGRQRLERGDTGGTGQPLQPRDAGPRRQRLERGGTG